MKIIAPRFYSLNPVAQLTKKRRMSSWRPMVLERTGLPEQSKNTHLAYEHERITPFAFLYYTWNPVLIATDTSQKGHRVLKKASCQSNCCTTVAGAQASSIELDAEVLYQFNIIIQ